MKYLHHCRSITSRATPATVGGHKEEIGERIVSIQASTQETNKGLVSERTSKPEYK
jgi:hypothetical protein